MKHYLIIVIIITFCSVYSALAETVNDSNYQINIQTANLGGSLNDSDYGLNVMSNNIVGVVKDTNYEVCVGLNCQVYPLPNVTTEEVIIIPIEEGGGSTGGGTVCSYGFHLESVGSSQYCTNCIGDLYEKEGKVVCTSCEQDYYFSSAAKKCIQTKTLNYYIESIGSKVYEKNYVTGFIIFCSFIVLFLAIVLIYTPLGKKIRGEETEVDMGGGNDGLQQ